MSVDTYNYYQNNFREYFEITKNIVIKEQIDRFLSLIDDKNELIIDLGCGSGNCLKYIAEKKYSVAGVDYSDELIKLASEYSGADVYNLNFENVGAVNKFIKNKKAVHLFASASLLHLKKFKFIDFINKINFNGFFFFSLKEGEGEICDSAGRFFSYYTKGELDALLKTRFNTLFFDLNADKLGRGNNWLSYIVELA